MRECELREEYQTCGLEHRQEAGHFEEFAFPNLILTPRT